MPPKREPAIVAIRKTPLAGTEEQFGCIAVICPFWHIRPTFGDVSFVGRDSSLLIGVQGASEGADQGVPIGDLGWSGPQEGITERTCRKGWMLAGFVLPWPSIGLALPSVQSPPAW